MSAPLEYVFLAGDVVPDWIERVTVDPPEAGRAWMSFCVPTEAQRYPERVVIRPLFPLTADARCLMRLDTDGYVAGTVNIHGGPTHICWQSRYFPNDPSVLDIPLQDDDDADPWGDPLNGETPR